MFNIEVDADHCYRVGEQGILVHNASSYDVPIVTTEPIGYEYAGRAESFRSRASAGKPYLKRGKANLGYLKTHVIGTDKVVYLGGGAARDGIIASMLKGLLPVEGHDSPPEHSEQQLFGFLTERANDDRKDPHRAFEILEIFTERSPCSDCGTFLTTELGLYNLMTGQLKMVPIYYVKKYEPSDDTALIAPYRVLFPDTKL